LESENTLEAPGIINAYRLKNLLKGVGQPNDERKWSTELDFAETSLLSHV
jgi:hypothetical protein